MQAVMAGIHMPLAMRQWQDTRHVVVPIAGQWWLGWPLGPDPDAPGYTQVRLHQGGVVCVRESELRRGGARKREAGE